MSVKRTWVQDDDWRMKRRPRKLVDLLTPNLHDAGTAKTDPGIIKLHAKTTGLDATITRLIILSG